MTAHRRESVHRRCLLVLLPLLVAGCEWSLGPGPEVAEHRAGDFELTELKALYPSPMSIIPGADGAVWVVSKYDVFRFPEGVAASQELLLNPQIYERDLGRSMDSLSTAYLTPDGTLWAGSWSGEVLRYQGARWREIVAAGAGPSGKVAALLLNDAADDMWIGANNGLWRAVKKGNSLERVLASSVEALARGSDGTLVAGTYEGVYLWREDRFDLLWETAGSDGGVTALTAHDGGWWIGTHDGFVELDRAGGVTGRQLEGRWVTSILGAEGERVVGSWQSGLWFEVAGDWHNLGFAHGLPEDSVSALATSGDSLWLGLYGSGTYLASLGAARAAAVDARRPPDDPGAMVFDDACAAAAVLVAGGSSGGVSVERVEGETQVFFGRHRVCPDGPGHRRAAGELVVLGPRRLTQLQGGVAEPLPLPRGVEATQVRALLISSSGQLYLGTRSLGLFTVVDRRWRRVGGDELIDNAISALLEDEEGGVWVASSPAVAEGSGEYLQAGLHRYDGDEWRRWRETGDSRGPATGAGQSLALLADGRVAVGTNGGLSLWDGLEFESYQALVGSEDPFTLDNHFVSSITEDAKGRLWLAHSSFGEGITVMDRWGFSGRSSRDGLFADPIARIALDGEDRAWLLATDGRVGVYPLASLIE